LFCPAAQLKNDLGLLMNTIAITIAELRALIGYLGEKSQANRCGSEFFNTIAAVFLAQILNSFLFLAQYQGIKAASDTRNDTVFVQTMQASLANRELAMVRLAELARKVESASPSPVSLGQMSQDLKAELQQTGMAPQ